MESREWINDMVDKLNVRIEQFEYEMEELQAGLKKKAKPPPKLVQVRGLSWTQWFLWACMTVTVGLLRRGIGYLWHVCRTL